MQKTMESLMQGADVVDGSSLRVADVPPGMSVDLIEKISTFVGRCHVGAFLRDFDKLGLRRIDPMQAVRALSQAGLQLSKAEQDQLMSAYTGEDGKFSYDDFLGDVNPIRPVGYFESNPNVDATLTSPTKRFSFRGTCRPTLFQPRLILSASEEVLLEATFKAMKYETVMNPFSVSKLMRPFDSVQRGSVTTSRFKRVIATHFLRLSADMINLLAKSYAGPDDTVRYSALSRDVTPDVVNDGMPPHSQSAPPPSPNVRMEQALLNAASDDELREGFRVLLRTLHERRIRIGDVLRDFSLHAPIPGRVTRAQLIRGLSSIGSGVVSVDPRVIEGIADMYRIESDPMWVDSTACIRDLESSTYLRHLEQMNPDLKNETFGREVALSPNPRFIKRTLPADEDSKLQAILGELRRKAGQRRVFNVRIFASQFDKNHDGFLTKDRFMRVLSILQMLPEAAADTAVLLKRFETPRGFDYKDFLATLNLA